MLRRRGLRYLLGMPFWVALGAYLLVIAVDVVLVVAAFKTSAKLGLMALICPFYVVSFGNHRLATPPRRLLAGLWWAGFVGLVVTVTTS